MAYITLIVSQTTHAYNTQSTHLINMNTEASLYNSALRDWIGLWNWVGPADVQTQARAGP